MFTYFLKLCFSFQLDLDKGHNVVNFVAAYFDSFFFSTSSKDSSSFESNSQRSVLIKEFIVRGKICLNNFFMLTLTIIELFLCPFLFCSSQNLVLKQGGFCHLLKFTDGLTVTGIALTSIYIS